MMLHRASGESEFFSNGIIIHAFPRLACTSISRAVRPKKTLRTRIRNCLDAGLACAYLEEIVIESRQAHIP